MCGIVGYLGKGEAYPALIKGLKRLEYRGYDSAGVALISNDGALNVYKAKGKVADLEAFCSDKDISGHVGIAHTRWATHGEPSAVNAHPHYSSSKNLAMIHNGIIENYADIKKNLIAKGVEFKSETDTEVLVQLIEYIQIKKNLDLLTAVQVALRQVIGDGRRGCADRRRRAGRLGEGDARNLQGDLRLHPRRDRYFVRLPLQVHARRRTAVPARRTPPGPPAERDIPINASAQDKAARRRKTGGRFVSGAPNQ